MALIKCTECGQIISDRATKCPKCGCPIMKEEKKVSQEIGVLRPVYYKKHSDSSHKWLFGIIALLVVVIAIGVILVITQGKSVGNNAPKSEIANKKTSREQNNDKTTINDNNVVQADNKSQFSIEGTINSKYPIKGIIILKDGDISGRYCYKSTYNKYGDKPSTWITLNGSYDTEGSAYFTGNFYNNTADIEQWFGQLYRFQRNHAISFSGQYTARDGKTFYMDFHSIN